jgi:peptidoglycan hydrolase CwlO-like protein
MEVTDNSVRPSILLTITRVLTLVKYEDLEKAKDFVELHDQVETSVDLLNSLEAFLSGFQKDLSAVSGQISELQDRSKDIDNKLKSRKVSSPASPPLI